MSYEGLFSRATDGNQPFDWQVRAATGESLPQLIRVPTGAGKTEGAVLAWLWRRRFADADTRARTPRRLAYCLPMRVLVEQTVSRCEAMLQNVALAEQIAVHQLMGGAVSRDWKHRPEDDQILIGTLDQLLSRALLRGYGVSRWQWPVDFALLHNDTMWVFDEVQLFGEALATSAQLEGLRRSMPNGVGPTTSLWMSATVEPGWLHTVDHPSPQTVLELGAADRNGPLARRLSAVKTLSEVAVIDAKTVAAHHQPGTLTLCVMNTVKRAQELFTSISKAKALKDVPQLLVHSRFRPGDRREAMVALQAPVDPTGPGQIVVSTQVVEAGVDISAALLITEAAPWANLVQRFGRSNRYGELAEAKVMWAACKPAPYAESEVTDAMETLRAQEGNQVGPDALEQVDAPIAMPPRRFLLRRRDLVGLFDTAPDLTGLDLDVSRFIRDGDDFTVSLAWRALGDAPPAESERDLAAEELCPVAIGDLRDLVKAGRRVWRWNTVDSVWQRLGDPRPGDRLVTDVSTGCYSPTTGFTPKVTEDVQPVGAATGEEPEGVSDEQAGEAVGVWRSLAEHTDGVCRELDSLLEAVVGLESTEVDALRVAARLHDWGKAHDVFQVAMRAPAASGRAVPDIYANALLAKRMERAPRYGRPGFRHELASSLAYLAESPEPEPLVAYLIASHHGRVRLGARSLPAENSVTGNGGVRVLGCAEGDRLPIADLGSGIHKQEVDLSLARLSLGIEEGETYSDMALGLLDELGPIRLSFLEALLRTADSRCSRKEEGNA